MSVVLIEETWIVNHDRCMPTKPKKIIQLAEWNMQSVVYVCIV